MKAPCSSNGCIFMHHPARLSPWLSQNQSRHDLLRNASVCHLDLTRICTAERYEWWAVACRCHWQQAPTGQGAISESSNLCNHPTTLEALLLKTLDLRCRHLPTWCFQFVPQCCPQFWHCSSASLFNAYMQAKCAVCMQGRHEVGSPIHPHAGLDGAKNFDHLDLSTAVEDFCNQHEIERFQMRSSDDIKTIQEAFQWIMQESLRT